MLKRLVTAFLCVSTLCEIAVAQSGSRPAPAATEANREQVFVLGSAAIAMQKMTDNGITFKPTSNWSVGGGYRVNITHWLGFEGDYNYFRNSQKFTIGTNTTWIPTDVHAMAGVAAIQFGNPLTKRLKSYITVGYGDLVFKPVQVSLYPTQYRGAILVGGGDDLILSHNLSLRFDVKSYTYKAPDFDLSSLKTDKYTQILLPAVGVVYTF